jgi:hypothetical protein
MVQLGERTPDAAGETNGDIYDTGFRLPGAENASSSSSNASVTSRIPDGAASFEQRFENWASSPARVSSPTFDDRYGDWGSSPVPPQYQPPSSQSPGPTQTDYLDIRVLRRFVRAPDGSLVPAPLGVSNEP